MPLLLATAVLASQFGAQGSLKLPKGGTVPKTVKLNFPTAKKPRIAMFPIFFGCDVDSTTRFQVNQGFLDAIPTLEKNTKFWQFVGTKSLYDKLKGVNKQDPDGQWIDAMAVSAANAMKVDYYGALSLQRYGFFVEEKRRTSMVVGTLFLRDAKTNKPFGGVMAIGIANSNGSSAPVTIKDAIYDLIAIRLADPKGSSDGVEEIIR